MKLKDKWVLFLRVILGPGSAIFILLTIAGLILAFYFKTNTLFATLLSVLSSVFASIAGSFVKDDFSKLSSENVLEKKGRSAIRNLQSIGKQLSHICEWIVDFSKEKISIDQKRTLEEIERHLSTARMNVDSGFEDWVDIVPELAEDEEIERKKDETIKAYVEEWMTNQKALIESKDDKKTSEIKGKLSDLEKHISKIAQVQMHLSRDGIMHRSSINYLPSRRRIIKCESCGRYFPSNMTSNDIQVTCPVCKRKENIKNDKNEK